MTIGKIVCVAAAGAVVGVAAPASADELRGRYLHVGVTQVAPNVHGIQMRVGGVAAQGVGFDAGAEHGVAAELGWFYHGNWAVSATLTSSVLTRNIGTGALDGADLGADNFMLASLTTHYHHPISGWFRPYAGAGLGYFHPGGAYAGLVSDLDIGDEFGLVLQAGADFDMNERFGVFVDVKQFLISVEATGAMLGLPIEAAADLDPLVVNAGLAYRF